MQVQPLQGFAHAEPQALQMAAQGVFLPRLQLLAPAVRRRIKIHFADIFTEAESPPAVGSVETAAKDVVVHHQRAFSNREQQAQGAREAIGGVPGPARTIQQEMQRLRVLWQPCRKGGHQCLALRQAEIMHIARAFQVEALHQLAVARRRGRIAGVIDQKERFVAGELGSGEHRMSQLMMNTREGGGESLPAGEPSAVA